MTGARQQLLQIISDVDEDDLQRIAQVIEALRATIAVQGQGCIQLLRQTN